MLSPTPGMSRAVPRGSTGRRHRRDPRCSVPPSDRRGCGRHRRLPARAASRCRRARSRLAHSSTPSPLPCAGDPDRLLVHGAVVLTVPAAHAGVLVDHGLQLSRALDSLLRAHLVADQAFLAVFPGYAQLLVDLSGPYLNLVLGKAYNRACGADPAAGAAALTGAFAEVECRVKARSRPASSPAGPITPPVQALAQLPQRAQA